MKLLLRRNQRPGLIGKQVFSVEVRADLTQEEQANILKYQLGRTLLYESREAARGWGLVGLATSAAWNAIRISVTVDDLAFGKKIECKDIMEMIAIQEQITEAARAFKMVLESAARFGGEEVIEI